MTSSAPASTQEVMALLVAAQQNRNDDDDDNNNNNNSTTPSNPNNNTTTTTTNDDSDITMPSSLQIPQPDPHDAGGMDMLRMCVQHATRTLEKLSVFSLSLDHRGRPPLLTNLLIHLVENAPLLEAVSFQDLCLPTTLGTILGQRLQLASSSSSCSSSTTTQSQSKSTVTPRSSPSSSLSSSLSSSSSQPWRDVHGRRCIRKLSLINCTLERDFVTELHQALLQAAHNNNHSNKNNNNSNKKNASSFSNCSLSRLAIFGRTRVVVTTTTTTTLSTSSSSSSSLDQSFRWLLDLCAAVGTLKDMDFANWGIPSVCLSSLTRSIRCNSTLQNIDLQDNQNKFLRHAPDSHVHALFAAVAQLPVLERLEFSRFAVTHHFGWLLQSLVQYKSRLQGLYIYGRPGENGIWMQEMPIDDCWIRHLPNLLDLQHLDLEVDAQGDAQWPAFLQHLARNASITSGWITSTLASPERSEVAAVYRRNQLIRQARQERDNPHVIPALWAHCLARFAQEPAGASALFLFLRAKAGDLDSFGCGSSG